MAAAEELQLPKALIKRIIKRRLSVSDNPAARDANVSSEALLAFGEAAKVFISYVTCTANDVCQESKRQTISADDVLTALEDVEFGELIPALNESLEKFKKESKEKAALAKEKAEQRKAKAALEASAAAVAPGGDGEVDDEDELMMDAPAALQAEAAPIDAPQEGMAS